MIRFTKSLNFRAKQIVNYMKEHAEAGEQVFYDIYTDDKYDVLFSKDTNVKLSSDGKSDSVSDEGKPDGSEVSKEGKGDSVAPEVRTGDTSVLLVYGVLGVAVSVMLSALAIFRKKRSLRL